MDVEHIIDNDIFSYHGAKPVKRMHAADNPVSLRSAVRGLPMDLYDGAWLTGLTQREVESLQMSHERFTWMKVATV